MDENLNSFLETVREAEKSFDALMLLSRLIELMMNQPSNPDQVDPEIMDRVLNEIIRYGDNRVMKEMSK